MCLDKIIGLSKEAIACFGTAPAEYNASDSGLYLIDPIHGVPIHAATNNSSAWQTLDDARAAAILEATQDITMMLSERFTNKFSTNADWIGKREMSGSDSATNYGWRITPWNRSDQREKAIVITAIAVAGTGASTQTMVIKNHLGDTMASRDITIGASTFALTKFTTPIRLPLHDEFEPELEYFLTIPASNPKTTNLECCGGHYHLHSEVEISSGFGTPSNWQTLTGAAGISLLCRVECDDQSWICKSIEIGAHTVKSVIARATQARASAIVIEKFLQSGYLGFNNMFTQDETEALIGKRNSDYKGYLAWLVQNLPENFSNCWNCESGSATKIELLV